MKALYCYATNSFFKIVDDNHQYSDGALTHLANGQWAAIEVPLDFDGNVSHYSLNATSMVLNPESEWPENQIEEELTDGDI